MNRHVLSILCLVLLTLVSAPHLSAQFSTPPPSTPTVPDTMSTVGEDFHRNMYFAVGANIGLLSGTGLAGRASFPGGFAAQLAFFAVSVPGEKYGTHFNIGGELQYGLSRQRSGRLYGLLGMGYYDTSYQDTAFSGNAIANPFRIGLGLGYEYFTSPNFVVSLSGAITLFPTTSEFFPVPQLGFFYYFK